LRVVGECVTKATAVGFRKKRYGTWGGRFRRLWDCSLVNSGPNLNLRREVELWITTGGWIGPTKLGLK
jgi:hypothetical protein